MVDFLDGDSIAGGKVKTIGTLEAGTGLWHEPNTGATDETGFSALPGGCTFNNVSTNSTEFFGLHDFALWWTSTDPDSSAINVSHWVASSLGSELIEWTDDQKINARSVRCIKDN